MATKSSAAQGYDPFTQHEVPNLVIIWFETKFPIMATLNYTKCVYQHMFDLVASMCSVAVVGGLLIMTLTIIGVMNM